MSGHAIFMTSRDKASKKDKPLMVIIATVDNVVAAGDPATMSAEIADGITASFQGMPKDQRAAAIQDLVDRMSSGRRGYAQVIEVAPYVGAIKKRADSIVREFMGQRADAVLKAKK